MEKAIIIVNGEELEIKAGDSVEYPYPQHDDLGEGSRLLFQSKENYQVSLIISKIGDNDILNCEVESILSEDEIKQKVEESMLNEEE